MKKLTIKCVWLSPKRNFLKKVAFWALGSDKTHVQNAFHLWTSEVHKWKRTAARFWIITVGMCIYENVPDISHRHTDTNSSVLSHWPSSLCSSRRTPSPPRLLASLDFCALLRGKLLPLLLLSFFVFFNAILIFFF